MSDKSFTVIELLVVIAIIGVLASIVLVSLSGTRDRAQIAKTLLYSNQVYHSLGADIVGNWNFDEGSGTTALDSSGYNHHGTISGGATYTADTPYKAAGQGAGKYALSFDGNDDYVTVTNNSVLNFADQPFTVTVWGQATYKSGSGFVLKKSAVWDNTAGWALGYAGTPQKLYVVIGNGTTHIEYNTSLDTISSWKFLGFTRDTSNKIYFINDGQVTYTGLTLAGSVDNATNLFFGRNATYLIGQIDEVRIYSRALTASEIQKLYAEGLERHQDLAIK